MYRIYLLISSDVMPSTGPISNAKSINLSSSLTTVLQQSTMSSFTACVRAPVSFAKVWNIFIIPSQCKLSSRIDQVTICPIPFILLSLGKFINIANEANNCRPSVKPPKTAIEVNMSLSLSTPNFPK